MTSDEIIGFKKSSKINGLKLDETCRTPNSYFKGRVLIILNKKCRGTVLICLCRGQLHLLYFTPVAVIVLFVRVPS